MLCPNCHHDNIPGVDVCESCGTDLAGLDLPEAGSGFRGKLLTDRIGDMKIAPPHSVAPDESVADAIRKMREVRSGCVLIVRDGELQGLLNERHVLTRVIRAGLDAEATAVSEVMSSEILELSPEDPPAFAVHCMVVHGFRHLPVVSNGEILGVISVRNILAYLQNAILSD